MRGPHDSTGDQASLILTPPPSSLDLHSGFTHFYLFAHFHHIHSFSGLIAPHPQGTLTCEACHESPPTPLDPLWSAIIINFLQPCIPAQNFVDFLRLSQSAQSVQSSRFRVQTIIRCTKTSGFASERWFSTTTPSMQNFARNFMPKCCSFQMSSDGGST